jgi:hypothetical protein
MSTFWSANTMEPKRAFRWVADINLLDAAGKGVASPSRFLISKFTKPTLKLDYDSTVNEWDSDKTIVTKNAVWDDISISMIDVENKGLNATRVLWGWLKSIGYHTDPNRQIDPKKGAWSSHLNHLNISLQHLNASGKAIERWNLVSPVPTSIEFDGGTELSYGSDEVMTVRMNIAYKYAEYDALLDAANMAMAAISDIF